MPEVVMLPWLDCPARLYGAPGPLPDEVLSSWFFRLSVGASLHPSRVQKFLGLKPRVENLDFDGSRVPNALHEMLHSLTGAPLDRVNQVVPTRGSVLGAEDLAYLTCQPTGAARYSVCAACLEEDDAPYIRRNWRLSHHVVCMRHDALLRTHCQHCGMPLNLSRRLRSVQITRDATRSCLSQCANCNAKFSPCQEVEITPEVFDSVRNFQLTLDRILAGGYLKHPRLGVIPAATVISRYFTRRVEFLDDMVLEIMEINLTRCVGPMAEPIDAAREKLRSGGKVEERQKIRRRSTRTTQPSSNARSSAIATRGANVQT